MIVTFISMTNDTWKSNLIIFRDRKEARSISDRSCQNWAKKASFKVQQVLQMSVKKNSHNDDSAKEEIEITDNNEERDKEQSSKSVLEIINGMRTELERPF